MIYNDTFQSRFVTGRYTSVFLSVAALFLWIIGSIFYSNDVSFVSLYQAEIDSLPYGVGLFLSFLLYVAIAYILNSLVILESNTPWLAGFFLWLTAPLFVIHSDVILSLSTLLSVMATVLLLSCYQPQNVERRIYTAYLVQSCVTLLFPQAMCMFLLFAIYLIIVRALTFRRLFAAFLGVVTPYWLLFGTIYIIPSFSFLSQPFEMGLSGLLGGFSFDFSLPVALLLFMAFEFLVMTMAVLLFGFTSSPANPIMRDMLKYIMIGNFVMWVLSWFANTVSEVFLAWRMPGFAILSAYVFTVRYTKPLNIFFVIFNIVLLIVAALGIWNG